MTNSIALLNTSSEMTMTLKEITDMLKVRHNDAMQTVVTMAKSPDFGELRKSRSSYKNNFGATLPLDTYALNKRQSIAVAARLNTSLLMSIIDRWQELEDAQRAPAAATKPLADMTKKELLMSLTELACDTEDMVHAMNGKLALGRFCTWTQYCKANAHLYAFRNPMKLCWMPAMIAARADIDGWETHTMGNQAATSALSPQTYPSHLLHDFVKHTLGSRDKYAHLASQVVPYVPDITLEIPAATKVLLDRAKMVALQLRDMTNA